MTTEPTPDRGTEKLTLVQLLPNMLTVIAICAGLTAIRLGLQGSYEYAVQLILLAAVLTRLLEPAAGVGALAAVLLAQWLLGVGASAWDQRKMGGKIEPPTRK